MRTTTTTLNALDGTYRATCLRRGAWTLELRSCRDAEAATFDERLPVYVRRIVGDDLGPLCQFTEPNVPVLVTVNRGERIAWQPC